MKRKILPWIVACSAVFFIHASFAQIYRVIDEHGHVTFTDKAPDASSEAITLKPLNTSSAVEPASQQTAPQQGPASPAEEYSLSIASPSHETTIPMGPGNFSVVASTSPALNADETLQLKINGENRGPAQSATTWNLTNVFRGEHQLSIERLSAQGEVLARSETITVYVLRPSINFRNRN